MIDEREITIGQLAESVSKYSGIRCTPEMINNYAKQGLVQYSSRTKGGVRLFKVKDMYTVLNIKQMQKEGLSLAEIKNRIEKIPDDFSFEEFAPYLPEDKRAQILKASAKIFLQKGYEATTMQDIATEANISVSMIYQFYKSKEDLFFSFTEDTSFRNILSLIKESLVKEQRVSYQDIRDALFEVALNFSQYHANNFEFVRLLVSTARTFPDIGRKYFYDFIEPTEGMLTQYFTHLEDQGYVFLVNPKNLVARLFFATFADLSLVQNFYLGYETPFLPDQAEIRSAVELFVRGMLEPPKQE